VDQDLLSLLQCPFSAHALRLAEPAELKALHQAARNKGLRDPEDQTVTEILEDCLVCESCQLYFPVRSGFPILLPSEALHLV
jgi:uncharacterized protein YbaR (Trm112 family)